MTLRISAIPINNRVLFVLGAIAIGHSVLQFGTGSLPEAILALLLFIKAANTQPQHWGILIVGALAIAITWVVNSSLLSPGAPRNLLSGVGIAAFAVIAFSRVIFDSKGERHDSELKKKRVRR